jgi:hypothetical protein
MRHTVDFSDVLFSAVSTLGHDLARSELQEAISLKNSEVVNQLLDLLQIQMDALVCSTNETERLTKENQHLKNMIALAVNQNVQYAQETMYHPYEEYFAEDDAELITPLSTKKILTERYFSKKTHTMSVGARQTKRVTWLDPQHESNHDRRCQSVRTPIHDNWSSSNIHSGHDWSLQTSLQM